MKLALLVLLGYSTMAPAVCLEGHVPIRKEYSRSAFVLTASVVSIQVVPDSKDGYFVAGSNYELRPVETLKGSTPPTITVFSENSTGRFDMERGKRYLVFIYRAHGRLRIDNCGKLRPLRDFDTDARKSACPVAYVTVKYAVQLLKYRNYTHCPCPQSGLFPGADPFLALSCRGGWRTGRVRCAEKTTPPICGSRSRMRLTRFR